MTNKQMLPKLRAAQRCGDWQARDEVVMYVFRKYHDRIARFYSRYPMFSREDIEQEFLAGICEGIGRDKGKGDSLYFIGQFAVWRVQSMVRAVRFSEHGALEGGFVNESLDDLTAETSPVEVEDHYGQVVARVDSKRQVAELLVGLNIKPQLREVTEIILSERLGEPGELGLNKRLAAELGLSPQRVSQIVAEIRTELVALQSRETHTDSLHLNQ